MIPSRRFRLIDAALLVATLAVAMGIHRAYWASFGFDPFKPLPSPGPLVSELFGVTTIYSLTTSTMLVLVQSLPPRSPRAELATRPGFMACLVLFCVAVAVAALSPLVELVHWSGRTPAEYRTVNVVARCFSVGGPGVAACWLSLAFGRNWKPAPTWMDRLGRAVGVWVIVNYPARLLVLAAIDHLDAIIPIVPR